MGPELGAPGRGRIVVGDDSPELLATTTRILRDAGFVVYATYNGYSTSQAAVFVRDLDLLITNTRLVGLSATELIQRVRHQKPQLPVLHIGEPLLIPGVGNVPTLAEPFSPNELLAAVEQALRSPTPEVTPPTDS